jgi:hypothetical protein
VSDKSEAERLDRALETIDQSKRDAMRKLITTAAFAVPVVASFAIDGLVVSPALAANGSSS